MRRGGVGDADGVDSVRRHLGEVPLHRREIVVLVPRRIGGERSVGHAAHVQLLVADKEELPAHTGPDSRGRCWGGLKCRRGWLHLAAQTRRDRKSTRLNSSHGYISYAVFCLKKKNNTLPDYNPIDKPPTQHQFFPDAL